MSKRAHNADSGSDTKRHRSNSGSTSKDAQVARYWARQFPGLPTYFDNLKNKTREELVSAWRDRDPDRGFEDFPDLHLYQDLIKARDEYKAYQEYAKASARLGTKKYVIGGLADDTLTVAFMAIGSGDCIFIKTPEGHVFVVDCGSRKRPEGDYRKRLQDVFKELFLKPDPTGAKKDLKAMILTHPDKDHYNEIVPIFEPVINKIEDLFHSLDLRSYNGKPAKEDEEEAAPADPMDTDPPPGTAAGAEDPPEKTLQFLAGHAIRKHRVTINAGKPLLETESAAKDKKPPYEPDQATNTITVHKEDWHGSTCEIILLAGGVTKKSQSDLTFEAAETRGGKTGTRDRYEKPLKAGRSPTPTNTASIVTLIKARDKKLLLCGDATYLTELFLLQKHPQDVTKVDVAQVEHHGAGTAHAAGIYVEKLDPYFAAISTGKHGGDQNPRWRVIEKYLGYKKMRDGDSLPQEKRTVRLKNDQEVHLLETFDLKGKLSDLSLWTPHQNSGLFSTRDGSDLVFTLGRTGEWQRQQKKTT